MRGINESSGEKGISHYIEHMLYKGTPSRDVKKIAEEIERNGGVLNGFTDEAITAYWCKMPSKHLNTALDVLSDMVKNPLFDEKEMEKERYVVFGNKIIISPILSLKTSFLFCIYENRDYGIWRDREVTA